MLPNIVLPDFKIYKDKNRKNAIIDSYHSSKNNFFDRNLLKTGHISDKTFSNNENREKLLFTLEKVK